MTEAPVALNSTSSGVVVDAMDIAEGLTAAQDSMDMPLLVPATTAQVTATEELPVAEAAPTVMDVMDMEANESAQEHRAEIQSSSGVPSRVYGRWVYQLDYNTHMIIATFKSTTSAAKAVGIQNGGDIGRVCSGKQNSAGGYRWRYVLTEEIDQRLRLVDLLDQAKDVPSLVEAIQQAQGVEGLDPQVLGAAIMRLQVITQVQIVLSIALLHCVIDCGTIR